MHTGTLYKTNGSVTEVKPKNGKEFSLSELQEFVGGYIQLVPTTRRGATVYCDEEGKLSSKPFNMNAMNVAVRCGFKPLPGDVLVGDVILVKTPRFTLPQA